MYPLAVNNQPQAPIGVFDSGIGGLSILKALRLHLPNEAFVYYADSAHAPYGEKTDNFIRERCLAIAHELCHQHAVKALVVACNTATAVAIADLRLCYPNIPIIGLEPALKPALSHTRTNKVIVMATRATLSSHKFQALLTKVQPQSPDVQVVCQPCDGLAAAIERHCFNLDHPEIHGLVQKYLTNAYSDGVDVVVLGCTHYPLVLPVWQAYLPQSVRIIDSGVAVAQQLKRRLQAVELLNPSHINGQSQYLSSAGVIDKMQLIVDSH
jgi:glutamate racemase